MIRAGALPVLYGNPNVRGFANSSETAQGTDDRAAAMSFIVNLKPAQIGRVALRVQTPDFVTNNTLLVCSVKWAGPVALVPTTPGANPHAEITGLNPWRYISSAPTNHPGSYDLWVDLYIGGRTFRVSNWSKEAQLVL
jgi:hypothetical protein